MSLQRSDSLVPRPVFQDVGARLATISLAQRGILDQTTNCLREAILVAGYQEPGHGMHNRLAHSSLSDCDHWLAACHGLERDQSKWLSDRRIHDKSTFVVAANQGRLPDSHLDAQIDVAPPG